MAGSKTGPGRYSLACGGIANGPPAARDAARP
jgi:hypothetical protein